MACNKCAEGYFGDPSHQTCQACPCPETRKNFAKGCHMIGDEVSCICKQGYTGPRCDKCLSGYYGSPHLLDGKCEPCNCNRDGIRSEGCHPLTGQCDCADGINGLQCDRCEQRRHVLERGKCTCEY